MGNWFETANIMHFVHHAINTSIEIVLSNPIAVRLRYVTLQSIQRCLSRAELIQTKQHVSRFVNNVSQVVELAISPLAS